MIKIPRCCFGITNAHLEIPGYLLEEIVKPDERLYWYKVSKFLKNYDGDSFWVELDVGFGMTATLDFRLEGIDTPELGSPEALAARDYLRGRFTSALAADKPVYVRTYRTEKFGRWLARVYVATECVNDTMLEIGLGVPYSGGKR